MHLKQYTENINTSVVFKTIRVESTIVDLSFFGLLNAVITDMQLLVMPTDFSILDSQLTFKDTYMTHYNSTNMNLSNSIDIRNSNVTFMAEQWLHATEQMIQPYTYKKVL